MLNEYEKHTQQSSSATFLFTFNRNRRRRRRHRLWPSENCSFCKFNNNNDNNKLARSPASHATISARSSYATSQFPVRQIRFSIVVVVGIARGCEGKQIIELAVCLFNGIWI